MDDAILNFGIGKDRINRWVSPIKLSAQAIKYPPRPGPSGHRTQLPKTWCSHFPQFIFLRHFPPIQIDTSGNVCCCFHKLDLVADMIVDATQEIPRINRFGRLLLLLVDNGKNFVRD